MSSKDETPKEGSAEWCAEMWGCQARPGGYEARCQMALPAESMAGARVLDVGCRRGKGCYKLSEAVGAEGLVVGLDWDRENLEAAERGVPRALERSGLAESNMVFAFGYPENLAPVAVQYGPFDYLFANSIINLSRNMPRFFYEAHDALRPGGKLVLDIVVAPGIWRGAADMRALELGNAVQAATSQRMLEGYLRDAHFASWTVELLEPVHPSEGFDADHPAPFWPDDPDLDGFRRARIEAVASASGRR